MKNFYIKKSIICIMAIIFSIILMPNNVQAKGLQANRGGVSIEEILNGATLESIREIESSQGALGTEEKEGGNGIDCHMAKPTEWGTVSMLAASRYGVIQEGQSDYTTTGNKSGIYQMSDSIKEWLCTTNQPGSGRGISNIEAKYLNIYISRGGPEIPGDALGITWYNGNNVYPEYDAFVIYRGNSGYFRGRKT